MKLEDFIANETVKQQLSIIFEKDRFPHAIIVQGDEGTGRSTIASIIANAAVCQSSEQRPCGICHACLKCKANSHPDIIYPEATGNAKSFRVDTIRELREQAYILPNEARHKVYILRSAGKMTQQAQSAFLKVLEEPPKHVIFILTCDFAGSLLPTVRSRCQIFSLRPVDESQAIEFLTTNCPAYSDDQIKKAVHLSHGNIGLALNLLSGLTEIYSAAESIGRALVCPTEWELLTSINIAAKDRTLFRSVLLLLEYIFHESCLLCYREDTNATEIAKLLSCRIDREKLWHCIEILRHIRRYLHQNVGTNLLAVELCAKFRDCLESSGQGPIKLKD